MRRPSNVGLLVAALLGAALFLPRLPHLWPLVPVDVAAPADEAETKARRFLATVGIDVTGHAAAVSVSVDAAALDAVDATAGRAVTRALVPRTAMAVQRVTFKRFGDPHVVVALVRPRAGVVGWWRTLEEDDPGGTGDPARAEAAARAALAAVDESDPRAWDVRGSSDRDWPARTDRTLTFERVLHAAPEVRERAVVRLSGGVPTLVQRAVVVPDSVTRARAAAEAPREALAAVGFLLLAVAVVGAFVVLLRTLRDGLARIGAPGAIAILCLGGILATFLLEPDWWMAYWYPLWPRWLAPVRGLQAVTAYNAWIALVLFTVIAAGDAEDRRGAHGRGATLWRLLRGGVADPSVGAASLRGFLVGCVTAGVLSMVVWLGTSFGGATVALQPRGFFMKVLDSAWPSVSALLFFLAVALAEELGYRFFAGTWLERLTGRPWVAILVPAVVYGLTHTPLDFLPPADPWWLRPAALTAVGAVWGWAFFRYDALTVVLSHFTADLFIFNWPRLASPDGGTRWAAVATIAVPLLPAAAAALVSWRRRGRLGPVRGP